MGLGGSSILGGFAADWWNRACPGSNLSGWQFAFLIAALPGLLLALLLWRLREPPRGAMDGIPSAPDPAPFRASAAVLGSVTPGLNWVSFYRRGAPARYWLFNGAALLLIGAAMMTATAIAGSFSPRPPLEVAGLRIDPHVLQWSVVGFGLFVIVNLLQGLSLADRPAFAVIGRSPALIMVMAVGALQTMINYGIMGFTPSFLMMEYDLSPGEVGLTFGLLSAAIGIIGPLITGPLSDRINLRFPGSGRIWVTLFSLGVSPLLAFWVYSAESPASFYARFFLYSIVLTGWLPPLYAVMYDQVLPRMRGMVTSLYLMVMTILGLGIGPYLVGMIADAKGGRLGPAILSIYWVAPAIILLLLMLARRVRRDEAGLLDRARAAGEPV